MENSNAILFYHSKTPLYQYTIPFYNTSTSQNSIFIKILFFNPFFIISSQPFSLIFLGFSIAIFISLSSTGSTHNTHPLYTDQPIQTHHHTPTHINTNIKPTTKPHTNTTQQQSQATHTNTNPFKNRATDQKPRPGHRSTPPINQSTPLIWNPGHRSKTGANPFKKKPSPEQTHSNPFKKHHHQSHRSKPIQKNHHRSKPIQTHSKNNITGTTEQTHSIKSSPEPSEQILSKKWERWESRDKREDGEQRRESKPIQKTSSSEPPEQTH